VEALQNLATAAEGQAVAEAAAACDKAARTEQLAAETRQDLEAMRQHRKQELDRMLSLFVALTLSLWLEIWE
jgi:hypothetical protein